LNITVQQLAQEKDKEYRKIAEMLQAKHKTRSQLQLAKESQSKTAESYIREVQQLQEALQEAEKRHRDELNEHRRRQIGQAQSETLRMTQAYEQLEQAYKQERRRMEQQLYQKETMIRQFFNNLANGCRPM